MILVQEAAGGTAIKIIDVTSISSVTVTVGMGGTATPYNYNEKVDTYFNANEGQPSSFGSHCSATGGSGGRSYYTNNATVTDHAIPVLVQVVTLIFEEDMEIYLH